MSSARVQLKNTHQGLARVAIRLAGLLTEEDTGAKWVQVTREGNFPGYAGGARPFSFTRKDLDDMVSNIQSHPSYVKGADGVGTARVIPWDYNHASEQDPTSGNLPVEGAPAQAWTYDLQVRVVENVAQLWALTEFLEPARTYVRSGQYQWASVAVWFNATHAETGANVGALITSIALTNTPFVEGMEKLVANKQQPAQQAKPKQERRQLRYYAYDAARNPSEAICMMREMFGLPETSGVVEVQAQISIVKSWYASGVAPLGTDPAHIVSCLRTILNLPALAPDLEVLQEASNAIQQLLDPSAVVTPSPDGAVQNTKAALRQQQEKRMNELLKYLASLLGVRENEDAVRDRVQQLVALSNGIKDVLKADRDSTEVLCAAAKKVVDQAAEAREKLAGIFDALGVEKSDEAMARIAETMENAGKLKTLMPELESLRADKKVNDEKIEGIEVDAAIAAYKLDPKTRKALLAYRRSDAKGFAEEYPAKAPEPETPGAGAAAKRTDLTRPAGTQLSTDGTNVNLSRPAPAAPGGNGNAQTVDLAAYPGINGTARAKAYLKSTVPNWDKLTNDEQFLQAVALRKQPHVIDSTEAAA